MALTQHSPSPYAVTGPSRWLTIQTGFFVVALLRSSGMRNMDINGTGPATADFVGNGECALSAKFVAPDKIVAAGYHNANGNANMVLTRFEINPDFLTNAFKLFLPLVTH